MEQKPDLAEERRERIKKAQEALRATGKSPRELGEENERRVIDWIYRWGWSGPGPINLLLGRTSGGYAKRLVKKGLLCATRPRGGVPREFYTLTASGLKRATRYAGELRGEHHEYRETDPLRVNQQHLEHYLMAQTHVAELLADGTIDDFRTERQQGHLDQLNDKRPDTILIAGNQLIGLEIELDPKWKRRLDEFVYRVYLALYEKKTLNTFIIASDSQALLDRYEAAFAPGAEVPLWEKNERHHWQVKGSLTLPDDMDSRVMFVKR